MKFTTIYRNGKPQYFFIKLDNEKEFNFIQPYFFVTSMDRPKYGRILEMNCLFSGSVWQGRQTHGYGYSCSVDVYGTLIEIIRKLYGETLSEQALQEINAINTHDEDLKLSLDTLSELATLNERRCIE